MVGWVLELAGKLRLLYIAFVVNSIILHYIIRFLRRGDGVFDGFRGIGWRKSMENGPEVWIWA